MLHRHSLESDREYSRLQIAWPLVANVTFLFLVLGAQHFVSESWWLFSPLVFAPAQIFLYPSLMLLLLAARKKRWKMAFANLTILLIAWPVL